MKQSIGARVLSVALLGGPGCLQSDLDQTPSSPISSAEHSNAQQATLAPIGPVEVIFAGISPEAVATLGDFAYVASIDGVAVFRVAQGSLERLFHVETLGRAKDVAVVGRKLYVAEGRAGMSTWTLDVPEKPKLVERSSLSRDCHRVVASEHGVAVLCSGGRIALVRPGKPLLHLSLPGEPRDAAWAGEDLYVASAGDGLLRVEVAGENLRVAYRDRTFHSCLSTAVSGERLFVGLRDKRILSFSVATKRPRQLGETSIVNRPTRLVARDDVLLVASNWPGDTGATWLDVSSDQSPRIIHRSPFTVIAGTSLGADRWLVARGGNGLSLLGGTNKFDLQAHVDGVHFDRVASDHGAAIAWTEGGTDAWTWSTSSGKTHRPGQTNPFADAILCSEAFCTLDPTGRVCRVPFDAQEKPSCLDTPEGGSSLAWQSSTNTLWMLDSNGGLHGFSVQPSLRATSSLPRLPSVAAQNYSRFAIEGDLGVAIDPAFAILQIADLGASPRWRGRYLLHSRPSAVALAADVAFVAEPRAGLQIIDVTNPDRPREAAWMPFPSGPFGVAAKPWNGHPGQTKVALALGEAGLWAGVWQDKAKLSPRRRSDTPGFAVDVAIGRDDLWVANGTSVLRVDWAEEAP